LACNTSLGINVNVIHWECGDVPKQKMRKARNWEEDRSIKLITAAALGLGLSMSAASAETVLKLQTSMQSGAFE